MIIHWNFTIHTLDFGPKIAPGYVFFGQLNEDKFFILDYVFQYLFLNKHYEDKFFILDYVFQYLFLNKHFLSNEEFKRLGCMINFTIHFITYFSAAHSV
jgi:hypothetical protein